MTNCQFIDKELFISIIFCKFKPMKKLILILLLTNSFHLFCQRFETINYGSWNNESTWKDNLIPPYQFYDSVLVKHPIMFDSVIVINAFFKIDSSGAICGHHKIIIKSDFKINGFFQCDSLEVDGGLVNILGPGDCVSTFQTHTFNFGLLSLTGGSLAVGPWFECRTANYFYLENLELNENQFKIYPNPTADFFSIDEHYKDSDFQIINALGEILMEGKIESKLDLSQFENGIYFLQLSRNNQITFAEKIVKN